MSCLISSILPDVGSLTRIQSGLGRGLVVSSIFIGDCVRETRKHNPGIKVEILVPNFRGRMEKALDALATDPPDVFNHNVETISELYKQIRPGSDYQWSMTLLQEHKKRFPHIPTKSNDGAYNR